MPRAVIAIGGNSLIPDAQHQTVQDQYEAAGVTDDLIGRISAVDLVRAAVEAVGGKGGGGRPDMAQAGGPDGANAQAALDAIEAAIGQAS